MTHPPNPYVGPSPLTSKNKLYGRDRELADLIDLLISERIVLLYSPSGAGKTSLLQAGLVPAIKERGFTYRNMIRVNTEPPPGLEDNRYSVSVMASLKLEGKPTEFGGLTLAQYLDPNPNGELLVFDQFEEVITTDPFNYKAKQRFFDEIGEALRARGRWALFAMREDYLARLDPYLRRVPTRLSNTFRMDLLSIDASIEAIRNPALQSSVQFSLEAAKKLAANLAGVSLDQDPEALAGRFVEPVQLQVACKSLWEKLPEGTTEILPAHIGDVANIDEALGSYYADSVEAVARRTGLAVRAIRVWFGDQLINRQGIRVQVLEGDGLDAAAAAQLEKEFHLVRSSERLGKTWIELAHDRLVAPVHANNDAWFEKHLTNFQRRALQWQKEKENPSLLMLGREIAAVKIENDIEERFRGACVVARKRRQTRRVVSAAVGAVIAVLAAIAIWQGELAKRNLAAVQTFLAQTMVDQAPLNSLDQPEQALAFLEDALRRDPESFGAHSWISTILTDRPRWLPVATGASFQADPSLKIIDQGEGMVEVVANGKVKAKVRHPGAVAAKFSADQRRLFTRAADGSPAIEWASTTGPEDFPAMADGLPDLVIFSPDGQRVIIRDSNSVTVWDWRKGTQVDQLLKDVKGTVRDVSAGGTIAVVDDGSHVQILDTATNAAKGPPIPYPASVHDRRATLSPNGKFVALYESQGVVSVWRVGAEKSVVAPKIDVESVDAKLLPKASFPSDGRSVAIGGSHSVTVFDLDKGAITGTPITFEPRLAGLALSPDGKLVTTSEDKVLLTWDVGKAKRVSQPMADGTFAADVKFSDDGRRVLGSGTNFARIWDGLSGKQISISFQDRALAFAFSPKGSFLAIAAQQVRVRRIWIGRPWGETSHHKAESELLGDLAGSAGGFALNGNHQPMPLPFAEWIRRVAALRAIAERSAPNEPTVASFLREYFGLDRK